MFGDGSDGPLNVLSGTATLNPNIKYNFSSIFVAAGATLTVPSNSTGTVLYLASTGNVLIEGTINLSGRTLRGQFTRSVVIDGTTYVYPSVQNGGSGTSTGSSGGSQGLGFGGGGSGASASAAPFPNTVSPGAGATGSSTFGVRGASVSVSTTTAEVISQRNGNNGTVGSSGGSGEAWAAYTINSGSAVQNVQATSGAGGSNYGQNGSSGSGSTSRVSGSGSTTSYYFGGGGGGAGGNAGQSGLSLVIVAPVIEITGVVNTSGTSGGNGGNGGLSGISGSGVTIYGGGGGGGGGGNAGTVYLRYTDSIDTSGTFNQNGGSGGSGGVGGSNNSLTASPGQNGLSALIEQVQESPSVSFSATPTTGQRPLSVSFTNLSIGGDTFAWDFGDTNTSSNENPTHIYTDVGTFDVNLVATNEAGSSGITREDYITVTVATFSRSAGGTLSLSGGVAANKTAIRSAGGTLLLSGDVFAIRGLNASAIERKTYMWKVYDEDNNYVGVLDDVITEPTWTEEINSDGSSMEIELARNSDSLVVGTEPLKDSDDLDILDSNNFQILTTTQSRNKVGPGSNIAHNYRVDLFVFYGEVSPILDSDSAPILDNNGETIDGTVGAPNGVRRFTGFISQINIRYGDTETTLVQLTSYGYDLDQYLVKSGSNTTVAFNSFDPSDIVKDGLDAFTTQAGGDSFTTYSDQTVATTGTVVSYTFRANTYSELLQKSLELAPPNWYYYVDLGSNLVYFQEKSSTARHQFILGRHINKLDLKSYIGSVVNEVLFTGGGDPALYKLYTRTVQAGTRRSLARLSDNRVTVEDSADIIANTELDNKENVQYRSTVTILDRVYDIESIRLGDTVSFRNFDSFVDTIILQVVGKRYTPDFVELQLDTIPLDINKRIEDITRNLNTQETITVPNAPTT